MTWTLVCQIIVLMFAATPCLGYIMTQWPKRQR